MSGYAHKWEQGFCLECSAWQCTEIIYSPNNYSGNKGRRRCLLAAIQDARGALEADITKCYRHCWLDEESDTFPVAPSPTETAPGEREK
jgi:hypothetical protein